MMKDLLILLFALVLAQGLTEEENTVKNLFEKDTEDLITTLLKEYFELLYLIEEVEQYQETQKISFAETNLPQTSLVTDIPLIESWDTDVCLNFTTTLTDATAIAGNISSWIFDTTLTFGQTLYHLLHCGSINPISSVSCIVEDFRSLKNIVDESAPTLLKFKNGLAQVVGTLKMELNDCIGIHRVP
uniref:Putative secreted protein n=1 Tax=Panstrongylus lignarius TaxID=156445 RepID=A0A224XLH8_9HEMI